MIVYCILFPNGKRYVGKTECSLEKRMKEHKHHSEYQTTRLYNAVRKYGWKNLDFIVLEECDNIEVLNEKERGWIKKFKCLDREKGYNLRSGGDGGRHADETKAKISESNRGEKNGMFGRSSWNKGKKHTEEHRRNLSKSLVGNVPWNKGKKLPPTGPLSEETKKKISKANSGENNGRAKLNWEQVRKMREEYATGEYKQKDLAKKYNINSATISQIINNKLWRENEQ